MTDPHLAITVDDPAGIGPKNIIKAYDTLRPWIEASDLRLLIIGSDSALKSCDTVGGETRDPRSARSEGMGEPVISPGQ